MKNLVSKFYEVGFGFDLSPVFRSESGPMQCGSANAVNKINNRYKLVHPNKKKM
jgi:hypothetical protein